VDSVQPLTDRNSARLTTGTGGGIYRTISGLSPSTNYTLSVQAKLTTLGGGFHLYASGFGGSEVDGEITNVGSWRRTTISFTTGSSNTSVNIGVWRDSAGTGSFDDFVLQRR